MSFLTMLTKVDIEKYFIAEKQESLIFLILGIIVIVLALTFLFAVKTPVFRGAAFPLLILGLIQVAAGYVVYNRSDDQRINGVYAYDMNPDKLKNEELPRMRKVNINFKIYRTVEIISFFTGLLLFYFFRNQPAKAFWMGFGIALALMAAELFIADFIAEKRAVKYTVLLESFSKNLKI